MELSEEIFQEIHRYLRKEGSPEQIRAFEERMRADEALAAEVDLQRRIRQGLKANQYRQVFKAIHAELETQGALNSDGAKEEPVTTKTVPLGSPKPSRVTWRYIAVAASLLLAGGLVWYTNVASRDGKNEPGPVIATEPAIKSDSTTIASSGNDTAKIKQPEGKVEKKLPSRPELTEYFASNFDADVKLDSPFSQEKLGLSPAALGQWRSDTARLQRGIQYLELRNTDQALSELLPLAESRFKQVKHAATWYAALAYVQQNNAGRSKALLNTLASDPENAYYHQATSLLSKIQ